MAKKPNNLVELRDNLNMRIFAEKTFLLTPTRRRATGCLDDIGESIGKIKMCREILELIQHMEDGVRIKSLVLDGTLRGKRFSKPGVKL